MRSKTILEKMHLVEILMKEINNEVMDFEKYKVLANFLNVKEKDTFNEKEIKIRELTLISSLIQISKELMISDTSILFKILINYKEAKYEVNGEKDPFKFLSKITYKDSKDYNLFILIIRKGIEDKNLSKRYIINIMNYEKEGEIISNFKYINNKKEIIF